MKLSKNFNPKTSKTATKSFAERKAQIARILRSAAEEDYTTEKSVKIGDEDFRPWSLYVSERTGSFDDYPEYSYIEFSLYIYDTIIDPSHYTELFHILRLTKPGDVFNIYINSPGGDVATLCSFASAIEESEAVVISHVDGSADSAAFVLACIGDETIFSEFSQMMSHNISIGVKRADAANMEKYIKNSKVAYKGMLKKYCTKVLTEEEINQICDDGREIHLSSEECTERMKKWYEERAKEIKELCKCSECEKKEESKREENED